jgi:hypothetical protein
MIPHGPIKQYTDEPSDAPTTLVVYPGADGESSLYDDDGHTFNHRNGEWMRVQLVWRDATRDLTLRLAPRSRTFGPMPKRFVARLAGTQRTVPVTFNGASVTVRL